MVHLNPALLIGRGLHRECYVHPEMKNRCIKVVVSGGNHETIREQAYYKILEKRNISWEMLPRFYGNIETDLGSGAVFDCIRDYDGAISKPLSHYMDAAEETERNYNGLSKAIPALKFYLFQQKVLTMTLKAKNIVYKRTSDTGGVLSVIDNIGSSDFIPVCHYLGFAAKLKIKRKWQRFESRLLDKYAHNKVLPRLLTPSKG